VLGLLNIQYFFQIFKLFLAISAQFIATKLKHLFRKQIKKKPTTFSVPLEFSSLFGYTVKCKKVTWTSGSFMKTSFLFKLSTNSSPNILLTFTSILSNNPAVLWTSTKN
jgi:hypothetical protein